jgi:predicted oxidoreductase
MTLDTSSSRSLGPLDPVGPLAFGHWRFVGHDLATATELVETALELGMNLIDTADVYGLDWGGEGFGDAERLLGSVLRSSPSLRDRMVLASKGGIWPGIPYDSSARYLTSALDASLSRLGVDRIDLYQIHRPDMFTHPEDLAATLRAFVEQGKVGAVGVSNFTPAQTEALVSYLGDIVVATQPQLSVNHLTPLRDGTLDQAMRLGLRPLAWSALGGGSLATGHNVRTELMLEIDALAARESVDRTVVALAFVLAHPSRPVAIVGSQKPERLRAATAALDVSLSRDDLYTLIEASEGEPLP